MAKFTEIRYALQAAVEPLLQEGENCSATAAPSEYETGGLTKLRFAVTVAVGPDGDERSAERLDELLSGEIKDALEASELSPRVTKVSGYQTVTAPGKDVSQIGATWTAEILE